MGAMGTVGARQRSILAARAVFTTEKSGIPNPFLADCAWVAILGLAILSLAGNCNRMAP